MEHCSAVAASYRHRHEAEMARGYLEDDGIPVALAVDDAGGAYAGLTLSARPARVLVRHEDLERARRLLAEAGLTGESAAEPEKEREVEEDA